MTEKGVIQVISILVPAASAIISTFLIVNFKSLREAIEDNTKALQNEKTNNAVHYTEATESHKSLSAEVTRIHSHIDQGFTSIIGEVKTQIQRVIDFMKHG